MAKRLRVVVGKNTVAKIERAVLKPQRCVYLLIVPKGLKYAEGRSRIAYIGRTRNGKSRILGSVSENAKDILNVHGVGHLDVYIVRCQGKQAVATEEHLEDAFLAAFSERHFDRPLCNHTGPKHWNDKTFGRWFRREKVLRIIEGFMA